MIEYPNALNDLMMAQQPIFKKSKDIFGYELLFREADLHQANIIDGKTATSQVLVNLCIGITELEAQIKTPFFVNMTTDLMLSEAFFPINPDTMYIEILEDQEFTPEFFTAMKKWQTDGYRFVLDDYQFNDKTDAILPWVSIVKINVLTTPPEKYAPQITELKAKDVTLLAKNIENKVMFDQCQKLSFDLYQGYYLQRPEIIKGKKIDTATHDAIELVNALQNKDISIEEITDQVSKSPKLSYQLLRILNSPICGIFKTVVSIKEAVIFLGLVNLKKWALLITLTSSSKQPTFLLKTLLVRGHCCQLLAENNQSEYIGSAFMVGLMSGIDMVFNIEKKILLSKIALDQSTFNAIMNQTGELGTYLAHTLYCEDKDWEKISNLDTDERNALNQSFLDALLWSEEVMQSIDQ